MASWSDLARQRVRWKRGAVENLVDYGLTRVTAPYWGRQAPQPPWGCWRRSSTSPAWCGGWLTGLTLHALLARGVAGLRPRTCRDRPATGLAADAAGRPARDRDGLRRLSPAGAGASACPGPTASREEVVTMYNNPGAAAGGGVLAATGLASGNFLWAFLAAFALIALGMAVHAHDPEAGAVRRWLAVALIGVGCAVLAFLLLQPSLAAHRTDQAQQRLVDRGPRRAGSGRPGARLARGCPSPGRSAPARRWRFCGCRASARTGPGSPSRARPWTSSRTGRGTTGARPCPGRAATSPLAAHRAGHGDPFLDFDTLRPGDEVVLEQRRGALDLPARDRPADRARRRRPGCCARAGTASSP